MAVIECVPNVSDGRVAGPVLLMAEAVSRIRGVKLLDRSSDVAHNRSVLTMAGDPAGLLAAVAGLFEVAIGAIDLRTHRGEHPRIGAVDVVPFVPLLETSMAECVELAKAAGALVAGRFGVPVYLYEQAATRANRKRLEDVRRGGFEGLAEKMAHAEWEPDFGAAAPHPSAGATAIGARPFLIAFNINLATGDLAAAKAIARRLRESSGGLPFVKALGLTLASRGIAQVSLNLTNFAATPIERVFDAAAALALERGVTILESELIGLIPEDALANTTPAHLRLKDFRTDQILENRLAAAGFGRS